MEIEFKEVVAFAAEDNEAWVVEFLFGDGVGDGVEEAVEAVVVFCGFGVASGGHNADMGTLAEESDDARDDRVGFG